MQGFGLFGKMLQMLVDEIGSVAFGTEERSLAETVMSLWPCVCVWLRSV